ncbi:uncharacterized protein LOC141641233 [Silene latifolia]|uniref:uncharacterized protein LOC141641233 n=1 Tax=Silene latifolia TaxID=37657 RepID=UPI003D78AA1C
MHVSTTIEVLEKIGLSSECVDDRAKAQIAIDHLESFDFIFIIHLMKVIFGYTSDLGQTLQRRERDIVNAMTLVDLTKDCLQIMRDDRWSNFFDTVSDFCVKHNIEVPNMNDFYAPPRRSRRFLGKVINRHRYRLDMFMSVIYKQHQELESRFDEKSTELLKCMACLSPTNLFAYFNKKKLFSGVEKIGLGFQPDLFIKDLRNDPRFHHLKNIGEVLVKLIETNKHLSYSHVCLLLKFILILPVATTSVERVFSSMTFVKNKSRNKLGDKLLNYCLIPFINRDFLYK